MSRKIICIIFASLFTCLVPINSEARKQKKALSDSTAVSVADTSRLEVAADSIAGRLDSLTAASLDSIDLVPLFSDEYLDTVKMKKAKSINDYTMIGVQYGVSLSQMRFNPTKRQGMLILPYNFGITYTRYGKMFGYMPYFGFQTGVLFGQDGYVFKKNKETGDYNESVDGATKAVYSYAEVPLLAHLHIDVWHLKLIVNLGLYAAYRLEVEREGERLDPQYANTF